MRITGVELKELKPCHQIDGWSVFNIYVYLCKDSPDSSLVDTAFDRLLLKTCYSPKGI